MQKRSIILFTLFVSVPLAFSQMKKSVVQFSKTNVTAGTLININRLAMWILADGAGSNIPDVNPSNGFGSSGMFFPRGNDPATAAIFSDGLVWGGQVFDGREPLVRVGGQVYTAGTTPGIIDATGHNIFEDRIWRIRRDYFTADLALDAQEIGLTEETVRQQYATDWQEWPADKGAPFYDANDDGVYTPQFNADGSPKLFPEADEPGLADADQVVWLVANDVDSTAVHSLYGSPSIGLEMQVTLWGFDDPCALGNVIFKRYRFIYKGTASTPDTSHIDSMYVCQWSDPDLGAFTDDFVGTDTTLDLGFTYNASSEDAIYAQAGLIPPAVGYDFLQGPMVASPGDTARFDLKMLADFRNLPMTSFVGFGGYDFPEPIRGEDYSGTLAWWNVLRGFRSLPLTPAIPWTNLLTGESTTFLFPGDPVTGSGWVDSNPADRRMLQVSGPFNLALGDTQEVVIGLIAGMGGTHLLSVNELKNIDRTVQSLYDNGLKSVLSNLQVYTDFPSSATTHVTVSAMVKEAGSSVSATFTDSHGAAVASLQLFDDGAHADGQPQDGLFANQMDVAPNPKPFSLNLTVQAAGQTYKFEHLRQLTTAGPLTVPTLAISSDNINEDGSINPGENVHLTASLHNGSAFDLQNVSAAFHVSGPIDFQKEVSQSFANVAAASTTTGVYDLGNPDTFVEIQISSTAQDGDSILVNIELSDPSGNQWADQAVLLVHDFSIQPDIKLVNHEQGPASGSFGINIVDPAQLTGHSYRITINDSTGNVDDRTMNLTDLTTNNILLNHHPLPDEFAHNMPVIDGFKLTRGSLKFDFGIDQFLETAFAGNPVNPPQPVWQQANSNGSYALSEPSSGLTKNSFAFQNHDLELRFTEAGGYGWWFFESGSTHTVPFEIWDAGIGTPDDPSDDVRMIPLLFSNGGTDGVFDISPNSTDAHFGLPSSDRIYFYTGSGSYNAFLADATDGHIDTFSPQVQYIGRLLIVDLDQDGQLPPTGTTIRITTFKPPSKSDVYTFTPIFTSVAAQSEQTPETFALYQNYPNPFNPTTSIRYDLPQRSRVTLSIFNILGQEVARLVDDVQAAGKHTVRWDATSRSGVPVSSGVYFYEIKTTDFEKIHKMLLVR